MDLALKIPNVPGFYSSSGDERAKEMFVVALCFWRLLYHAFSAD